ncbi:MAG TPA: DeoR family transcriptional regulator [Candidatus Dojkabacteria bacterium]|nr:DeoR family transcriptional regulator [Candidatus Dojkabacteria bacterium]
MYSPSYTITHLILNYIVKYELAMQKIKTTPIPASYLSDLTDRIKAEEIDKMGELIGNSIGYSKALEIQRGKILPNNKFRLFNNYRSVEEFINIYNSQTFFKPSIELSIHINKLLTKKVVDEWESGKLRIFSEKPSNIYDNWYDLRDFYPNLKPKQYFDEIYTWVLNPRVNVNKLIQLPLIMYEMIDKAPFTHLNQITTILTVAAVAKEYGYNPNNLIPFSKAINSISEDIKSAFKLAKSKRDLTIFIEAVLYTFSLTAIEVENMIINTYQNQVKKYNKLNGMFNPRQIKLLEYLEVEKKIGRHEYSKLMGISFMTAFRDLQELLTKGYLTQKGVGRGTFYTLKKGVNEEEGSNEIKAAKNDLQVFSDI